MQIHRVAYQTDLFGRLWKQLGQILGTGATQNAEEFLSYSHNHRNENHATQELDFRLVSGWYLAIIGT